MRFMDLDGAGCGGLPDPRFDAEAPVVRILRFADDPLRQPAAHAGVEFFHLGRHPAVDRPARTGR